MAFTSQNIPADIRDLTRQFIELQRTYNQHLDRLNQIRKARMQTEQLLITAISTNGLSGYGITYQGNKLTLAQDNSYDTLTYKFLGECLSKLYGDDTDKVKRVITFIKTQRTRQSNPTIKITGDAATKSRPDTPPPINNT